MVALSSLGSLVFSAAGCGSFSGVRVAPGAVGGPAVVLSFFFRSAGSAGLFSSWVALRLGVASLAAPSSGGRSFVVAVPVAVVPLLPAAPLWLPAVRGGSARGLLSLLRVAVGLA